MILEQELQNTLHRLFGIKVPIIEGEQTPRAPNAPFILCTRGGAYGDPWTGFSYDYGVVLHNFIRPNDGKTLVFEVDFTGHDLSGQLDVWSGKAENITANEWQDFVDLFNPQNSEYSIKEHLTTDVYINGTKIKLTARD